MSTVALETRQEKEKWLLRPTSIAGFIAWCAAIFGFVYYYFDMLSHETIIVLLVAALAVNAVLLIWGIARIQNVIRRG
jgi:hypothetical protein